MVKPRIVSWFSCGTASAVNTKLVLAQYSATHEIAIGRCIVPEEHADNDRFARDCAAWFGQPIVELRSADYSSCEDVWTRRRYMSGPGGAVCTVEMKKAVRHAFEQDWRPDLQAFGYTADEAPRAARFRRQNPEVRLVSLLIERGLGKADCHAMIERAGIELPAMYRLGFANANCIGCVAAQSPGYWNRVRRHFPDIFAARAALSRALGVRLVKGTSGERERVFLDDLDPALTDEDADAPECSLLCVAAESVIAGGAP
jgi:hypothetical protein